VPNVDVTTADGRAVPLPTLTRGKLTVLVIDRGGWCIYCNRQLAQLRDIQPQLAGLGYQILAISPDRPAKLRESLARHKLDYVLLSDSDLAAAKAFGLTFRVDDATFEKYKVSYKIDLEAASGRKHHMLPHPAVFLVGADGRIRFEHVDSDYRRRIDPDRLLVEARKAAKPSADAPPPGRARPRRGRY